MLIERKTAIIINVMIQRSGVKGMEIGDRRNEILRIVVNGYVESGEPVGSKAVAEKLGGVSSATIRNDMAELERVGLLEQPHTSSGRVPTVEAYRLFVTRLMPRAQLPEPVRSEVLAELKSGAPSAGTLLERAGQLLSRMTECASVAITPYVKGLRLLRMNLFVADSCVYVVVAVTSDGVSNPRSCRTRSEVSPEELHALSKAINERFADREINAALAEDMTKLSRELGLSGEGNALFATAVATLSDTAESSVYIGGVSQLLHRADALTAHRVVELLDKPDAISGLLRRIQGRETKVLLGSDSEEERLSDAAVIGCGYGAPSGEGSVALIGPMRLNYGDAVASVDFIAKTISELLSDEYR